MERGQKRRFRAEVEALGSRELPATGLAATLSAGVLTVKGTEQADTIRVQVTSRQVGKRVVPYAVKVDGIAKLFPASRISLVVVAAGGGDDSVQAVDGGRALKPFWLDGGAGNDALVGGAGNDVILGGVGNDVIDGRGGTDRLDGEDGRDTVNGVLEALPTATEPASPPTTSPPTTTPPTTTPTTPSPSLSVIERAIVDLTNGERSKAGVGSLAVSSKLTEAAKIQAQQLVSTGVFSHTIPGAAYPSLSDRVRKVGYNGSYVGENIAMGYLSAADVMDGWMNSSGHRANILRTDYSEIGVAVAYDSFGTPYYVQVFGRPMA